MKTKSLTIALVIIFFFLAAVFTFEKILLKPVSPQVVFADREEAASVAKNTPPASISTFPARETPESENISSNNKEDVLVSESSSPKKEAAVKKSGKAGSNKPQKKREPEDPMARIALSYVGWDESAENYWIQAINDPSLPAEERKDLIEDLNEDGLVNSKLAAPEDLPVIKNRILLVEDLLLSTTVR